MSWLAHSLANSLRLDDDEVDVAAEKIQHEAVPRLTPNDAVLQEDRPRGSALFAEDRRLSDSDGDIRDEEDLDGDNDQGRGMKEDLSEFKDSLTRQFWGVASFLAPPPPPPPLYQRSGSLDLESKSGVAVPDNDDDDDDEDEDHDEELVEYDERDSTQFGELANSSPSHDYYANILEDAVGITDEVLAFGRNIAHHPETWLDFPISEEEEFDDFDLSNAQNKHALAVEHLAPRLAALRFELCPVHMSEGYFWMVYFVLLHSRLNKHNAELLSSPQLVQARIMWMQELQKHTKVDSYWSGVSSFQSKGSTDSSRENFVHSFEDVHPGNESDWRSPSTSSTHHMTAEHEIEKHSFNDTEFIDKSVIKEDPLPKLEEKEIVIGSSIEMPVHDQYDDDNDDWLRDDSDLLGCSGTTIVLNEDDISFSDLEEDLDSTAPIKYKMPSTETA